MGLVIRVHSGHIMIIENGRNYPESLGYRNPVSKKHWPAGANIGTIPSVGMERKSLFPQGLPPRGTGLLTGRAGTRRFGVPRTEAERQGRHMSIVEGRGAMSSQMTKHTILPFLDRIKPLINAIKSRATIIPRTKLLGAFGLVGQKNIPVPRSLAEWSRKANVGGIPSIVNDLVSGPERTYLGMSIANDQ